MQVFFYSKQGETKETIGLPRPWIMSSDPEESGFAFRTILELEPVALEFDEKSQETRPKKKIAHKYRGPLYLDIDTCAQKEIHSLEDAWEVAKTCLDTFSEFGLSPETGLQIFFSGSKGYHIVIPQEVFGLGEQFTLGLPLAYKQLLGKLGLLGIVDSKIYSLGWGRQFRLPNIPRIVDWDDSTSQPVFGLCKVYLSLQEFLLGPDAHKEFAKTPRPVAQPDCAVVPTLEAMFNDSGKSFTRMEASGELNFAV